MTAMPAAAWPVPPASDALTRESGSSVGCSTTMSSSGMIV